MKNRHHPEYWDVLTDKQEKKLVDGTKMPKHAIIEMVCDWGAMSIETGKPLKAGIKSWAKKNINVRWKFTNEQEKFIYEIINAFKEVF